MCDEDDKEDWMREEDGGDRAFTLSRDKSRDRVILISSRDMMILFLWKRHTVLL
jgi:hypothetical protein